MDCLHICAYPKHALDGISVEESLRSTARSVAAATDAADMPRFVGSLFDAMCKFVAERYPVFPDSRHSRSSLHECHMPDTFCW